MDPLIVASIVIGVNVILATISKIIYSIKPDNNISSMIDRALVFFKKVIDIISANVEHDDKK